MGTLTIDSTACQQRGICVEICPMGLVAMGNDGFPAITEENEARCTQCGHCEAVCTTGALNIVLIGDACATKDLEVNGQKVKAEAVQNSFLAALGYFFSMVSTTAKFLSEAK